MLSVGLTGGIASGKSTVGVMFVELGCHLLDSDRVTHRLLEPGQPVHNAVVREFGDQILAGDGTIDRAVLGDIVFKNPEARQKLNSLVHPGVKQHQQEWLEQMAVQDPAGVAIVDAALMIEVGSYKKYDKLVVVTCSPEIQKRRFRERSPHLTDEQIDARIRSQMPLSEKVKYADFVIDNSGDLSDTRHQVEEINSRLREFAASTSGRHHS